MKLEEAENGLESYSIRQYTCRIIRECPTRMRLVAVRSSMGLLLMLIYNKSVYRPISAIIGIRENGQARYDVDPSTRIHCMD